MAVPFLFAVITHLHRYTSTPTPSAFPIYDPCVTEVLSQGSERRRPGRWPHRRLPLFAGGALLAALLIAQASGQQPATGRARLGTVVHLAGGNAGLADVAGDLVVRIDVLGAQPGTRIELAELQVAGVRVDRVLAPAFDEGGLSTVRLVITVDCPVALPGLARGVLALRLVPPGGLARSVRLQVAPDGRRTIVVQAIQTRCGVGPT